MPFFDSGKFALLNTDISWKATTSPSSLLSAALVAGYTYNHQHATLADIKGAGGSIVGTPGLLANRSVLAGGALDADDLPIAGVPSGTVYVGVLIYVATGTDSTSTTILWTPFPGQGSGNVLTVQWPNTADRIGRPM